jgi:hypothetical protein
LYRLKAHITSGMEIDEQTDKHHLSKQVVFVWRNVIHCFGG